MTAEELDTLAVALVEEEVKYPANWDEGGGFTEEAAQHMYQSGFRKALELHSLPLAARLQEALNVAHESATTVLGYTRLTKALEEVIAELKAIT